jgi:hypothetical protein
VNSNTCAFVIVTAPVVPSTLVTAGAKVESPRRKFVAVAPLPSLAVASTPLPICEAGRLGMRATSSVPLVIAAASNVPALGTNSHAEPVHW